MHVRRTLALAAVVPLLLAGCTDEPEPTPKMPDPTTSSPSPGPTDSETPEAESAEDFIRRWVEVGDEMQVTGETSKYRSLIDETCKACRDFASSVEDVYRSGGSVSFGGSTINRIAEREQRPPTYAVTKTLPRTVIRREGSAPEVLPAGKTTLLVILGKSAGDWTVKYYGIL